MNRSDDGSSNQNIHNPVFPSKLVITLSIDIIISIIAAALYTYLYGMVLEVVVVDYGILSFVCVMLFVNYRKQRFVRYTIDSFIWLFINLILWIDISNTYEIASIASIVCIGLVIATIVNGLKSNDALISVNNDRSFDSTDCKPIKSKKALKDDQPPPIGRRQCSQFAYLRIPKPWISYEIIENRKGIPRSIERRGWFVERATYPIDHILYMSSDSSIALRGVADITFRIDFKTNITFKNVPKSIVDQI